MQNLKVMFRSPRFVAGFCMVVIIILYAIFVPIINPSNPKEDRATNPQYLKIVALKDALTAQDDAAILAEIEKLKVEADEEVLAVVAEVETAITDGPMLNAISSTKQLGRKQPLVRREMDALGEMLAQATETGDRSKADAELERLKAHCAEADAFTSAITDAAGKADFAAGQALIDGFATKTDAETVDLAAAITAEDAEAFKEAAAAFADQHAQLAGWVAETETRLETPAYANAMDATKAIQETFLIAKDTPPNSEFWFGTDSFSRDIFLEMAHGARTSLLVGLLAGIIATCIGLALGLFAGFVGGIVDNCITAFTNTFIVIPGYVILILISIALGQIRASWITGIIIGLTAWPWTARAVRAQTVSLRNRDHVNMARITGYSLPHIIVTEILPYIASYVVMAFILQIASGIMSESTLAILGLGDPTGISLGRMMNWAMNYNAINFGRWWEFLPVACAIGMITFGLYMMNSGMDQVFNPKIRS